MVPEQHSENTAPHIFRWIGWLSGLMTAAVCLTDLLAGKTQYAFRQEFLLPNPILLVLGIALLLIACRTARWTRRSREMHTGDYAAGGSGPGSLRISIHVLSFLVFLLQMYVSCCLWFEPGWDASTVLHAARDLSVGEMDPFYSRYLSFYPNNVLQLILETCLLRLHRAVGILSVGDGAMAIAALQCAMNALTGDLIWQCLKKLTDSRATAFLGWGIYLVLLGTSGWVMFPYTDSCGLLFPILIYWIYLHLDGGRMDPARWGAMFLFGYWEHQIKATGDIVLIAVICVCLIRTLAVHRIAAKKTLLICLMGIAVFTCSRGIYRHLIREFRIDLNPGLALSVHSKLMMGINSEMDGAYNDAYSDLMHSMEDPDERSRMESEVIRSKLEEYGFTGLMVHTARKTLVNFNDGSFAWVTDAVVKSDLEGSGQINQLTAPVLYRIVLANGRLNGLFMTIKQMVWLLVLLLIVFMAVLPSPGQRHDTECSRAENAFVILQLTIVGSILFVTLFEARARYLYVLVPFYIMTGSIGAKRMIPCLNALICKIFSTHSG